MESFWPKKLSNWTKVRPGILHNCEIDSILRVKLTQTFFPNNKKYFHADYLHLYSPFCFQTEHSAQKFGSSSFMLLVYYFIQQLLLWKRKKNVKSTVTLFPQNGLKNTQLIQAYIELSQIII